MPTGTNDLGPLSANETLTEPANLGDSGQADYSWFKDCSDPSAGDGTVYSALFANRILKYLRRACDGMGIPRNETDGDRLLKAIQKAVAVIENVGSGFGLFKGVDGTSGNYQFRTLKAGTNVSIAVNEAGTEITVSALGAEGDVAIANEGGGAEVYDAEASGEDGHKFRTLVGGPGIAIALDGELNDKLKISATAAQVCLGAGDAGTNTYAWPRFADTDIGLWQIKVPAFRIYGGSGPQSRSLYLQVSFDDGASWQWVVDYSDTGVARYVPLAVGGGYQFGFGSVGLGREDWMFAEARIGLTKSKLGATTYYNLTRYLQGINDGVAIGQGVNNAVVLKYAKDPVLPMSGTGLPRLRVALAIGTYAAPAGGAGAGSIEFGATPSLCKLV